MRTATPCTLALRPRGAMGSRLPCPAGTLPTLPTHSLATVTLLDTHNLCPPSTQCPCTTVSPRGGSGVGGRRKHATHEAISCLIHCFFFFHLFVFHLHYPPHFSPHACLSPTTCYCLFPSAPAPLDHLLGPFIRQGDRIHTAHTRTYTSHEKVSG